MPLDVEQRLQRGDRLLMGLGPAGRFWWFEAPYQIVSDAEIRLLAPGRIVEAGDSLFGWEANSQTWTVEQGEAP